MKRKRLAENSFQREIVEFLRQHSSEKFSANDILKEINSRTGSSRTIGSISGTLKVLCDEKKGAWVIKHGEYHPSLFSYKSETIEEKTETDRASENKIDTPTQQDPTLEIVQNMYNDVHREIFDIDNKIKQLQKVRSDMQEQLKPLEKILRDRGIMPSN